MVTRKFPTIDKVRGDILHVGENVKTCTRGRSHPGFMAWHREFHNALIKNIDGAVDLQKKMLLTSGRGGFNLVFSPPLQGA